MLNIEHYHYPYLKVFEFVLMPEKVVAFYREDLHSLIELHHNLVIDLELLKKDSQHLCKP